MHGPTVFQNHFSCCYQVLHFYNVHRAPFLSPPPEASEPARLACRNYEPAQKRDGGGGGGKVGVPKKVAISQKVELGARA